LLFFVNIVNCYKMLLQNFLQAFGLTITSNYIFLYSCSQFTKTIKLVNIYWDLVELMIFWQSSRSSAASPVVNFPLDLRKGNLAITLQETKSKLKWSFLKMEKYSGIDGLKIAFNTWTVCYSIEYLAILKKFNTLCNL